MSTVIPQLSLRDALLFSDLAGTLTETDTPFTDQRLDVLLRIASFCRRFILVSGQCADDPQVKQLLTLFNDFKSVDFVAYVNRGGMRLSRWDAGFAPDPSYLETTRLDRTTQEAVVSLANSLLNTLNLKPLIPVSVIDHTAVRINLQPAERSGFLKVLQAELSRNGRDDLCAVAEGKTSLFVMRQGVGKRHAVEYELGLQAALTPAYYFGNEFGPGGNDRELFGISHLQCFSIGDSGSHDTQCCGKLADTPDDLYVWFEATMKMKKGGSNV